MRIVISNKLFSILSLDLIIGKVVIRETLRPYGNVDISGRVTVDEINNNNTVKSLIDHGVIEVTVTSEEDDIAEEIEDLSVDKLTVGDPVGGYTPPHQSWAQVDGTNPPTVPVIRMIDQDTGAVVVVGVESGVLKIL